MDEYGFRSFGCDYDDDPDPAEPPDPAVSAAIVAAAALVLSCAILIAAGLPARLHPTLVRAVEAPAAAPVAHRAPRVYF